MNKKSIAAAIALASLATAACAAPNDDDPNAIGPYLGAAYGLSNYSNIDCTGTLSCDKTPVGFKLIGGLPMSKNLALELQYVQYGEGDAVVQLGGSRVRATWQGRHFGVGVATIGNWGQHWTGIARVGLAENKMKGRVSFANASASENHVNIYAGGSIGYRVTPQLTVEAGLDLTRFELLDEKVTARQFNLGLRHSF